MNKMIKINEKLHKRLKKYVVNNDIKTIKIFVENIIERELNKKENIK